MHTTRQKGFTIVEMLVVILVIAILAAITIVAYNNVQERAKNSQWAAVAAAWVKVVQLAKVNSGSLPVSGSYFTCLGNNFPAKDGFAANECVRTSPSTFNGTVNTSFMTTLAQNSGATLPDSNLSTIYTYDPVAAQGSYIRGIVYNFASTDTQAWVEYYQTGAGISCMKGDSLQYTYNNNTIRCRTYIPK